MKWLTNFLAFLSIGIFISAFTMHAFLSTTLSSTELAESSFKEKTSILVETALEKSFSEMTTEQRQQFEQLDQLTPEQRSLLLSPQCSQERLQEQAFCDPAFISGQLSIRDVARKQITIEIEKTQGEAINAMSEQLQSYADYPLVLLSVLGFIFGISLYALSYGFLGGLQTASGNIAWMGFLSTISFKYMRTTIEKLFSAVQMPGSDPAFVKLVQDVMFDWLQPGMTKAFTLSIWICVIAFVVWGCLKLFRNYDVSVDQQGM